MYMLAVYDIAEPKRLNKVARILKDYGTRVQQSKFEIDVTEKSFSQLRERIERVIVIEKDGVKYIPLCEKCRVSIEIIGLGQYIDPDSEFYVL